MRARKVPLLHLFHLSGSDACQPTLFKANAKENIIYITYSEWLPTKIFIFPYKKRLQILEGSDTNELCDTLMKLSH